MPVDITSATSAYAAATDCTALRDWRQWADYLKDDNTRHASAGAVEGDANVARALRWASAELESAVTIGNRYKPSDLTDMAASTTVSKELLINLVVDLAFWWVVKRRKPGIKPDQVAGVGEALDMLERLRLGERVFPFTDTQSAGLPDVVALDEETHVETAAEPVSVRANRFFGVRR